MASNEDRYRSPPMRGVSPLRGVKREEPTNDEEGQDPESRITDLNKRLADSQQRARKAEEELEESREQLMEWLDRHAESERMRITAEQQLQQLQKEKKEAERTAEAKREKTSELQKEARQKYVNALTSSSESAKLMDAVKNEKRRLEKELEKNKADFEKERKDWNEKFRKTEKARAKLAEALEYEKEKKEEEDTKKHLAEFMTDNEDLQGRLKKLMKRVESLELSLTEANSKAEEAETRAANSEKELNGLKVDKEEEGTRLKGLVDWAEEKLMEAEEEVADASVTQANLQKELEEMRKINGLLATTEAGKIHDELVEARKRIHQLEKKLEAIAPKESEVKKRKKHHDMADSDFMGDEMEEGTSEAVKPEKRKRGRPSKRVSEPVKNAESMEDSEGDDEPVVKKERSELEKKSDNKRRSNKGESKVESKAHKVVSKNTTTDIQCPICEFRAQSVQGWRIHMRMKHSTSPLQSGFALLCGCGHESFSEFHNRECNNTNVDVIRKRFDGNKASPQCVLCDAYPTTVFVYAKHLRRHHKSSLETNGIYLLCSCDLEVRADHSDTKHAKKCDGREFTVNKLDEE